VLTEGTTLVPLLARQTVPAHAVECLQSSLPPAPANLIPTRATAN